MIRALEAEPSEGLRIWLRLSDGSVTEVDLSDLTGPGVFRAWDNGGGYWARRHAVLANATRRQSTIARVPVSSSFRRNSTSEPKSIHQTSLQPSEY